MIRSFRLSIACLFGALLVATIAVTAMWQCSETCAGILFLLTSGALCLAVVGLFCRGKTERAWWLGVSLFGWGYWALAFGGLASSQPMLPTTSLLTSIAYMTGFPANEFDRSLFGINPCSSFLHAGHCLVLLAVAIFGGMLARVCFGVSAVSLQSQRPERQPTADPVRWSWPGRLMLGSTALGLIVALAFFRSKLTPELWAGAIHLVTWGLIGVACLGALLTRGKAREICLGACFLGGAHMFMAFDRTMDGRWSDPRIEQFLSAVRVQFPWAARALSRDSASVTAANARILNALERPIPMRFADDTPFAEVLQYIKRSTRGPDGIDIPIYEDKSVIGLPNLALESTIQSVDAEGVPLKTSLRLCLEQLDLQYEVRDGLLRITNAEESLPIHANPFMIVGQCVLALIAAVVGGVLAPIVSDLRRRPGS